MGQRSRVQNNPPRVAAAVFALGVLVTLGLAFWQSRSDARTRRVRFDVVAERVRERVAARIRLYEYGLRGARGAAAAADFQRMSRASFRAYFETRDLPYEFPGARGVGIIRRVRGADEADFVARAREEGPASFVVRALHAHRGDRYVIQYVEPIARNLEAVGLDVASEASRKEAAEGAMREARATLTAPISLVQAANKKGFLFLLPIYAPGQSVATSAERQDALVGWAYSPLVIDEVLADFGLDHEVSLALTDTVADSGRPFYETPGFRRAPAAHLEASLRMPIYGRVWRADLKATPEFVAALNLRGWPSVGALGLGISLLLSGLALLWERDRARRSIVAAERRRRAAVVDATTDAVIGQTMNGVVTDWNGGARRLFGYEPEQAVERSVRDLIVPTELGAEDQALCEAVARGEIPAPFDTTRRCADGTLRDVSITVSPIFSDAGVCVGIATIIRDISDARRAEQETRRQNAELEHQVQARTAELDSALRDLQQVLDAVPSMISYWDTSFRARFTNRAFRLFWGKDPRTESVDLRQLLGDTMATLGPHFAAALEGKPQAFDATVVRPGTQDRKHCSVHVLPDLVAGEVRGLYVFAYDDTERQMQQAMLANVLRDREALLAAIHEYAIVSVTDRRGVIVDVNKHFEKISQFSRDELVGQKHSIISSGVHDRAFWREMWRQIGSGRPWRGVIQNRAKDGTMYWVDSMIAPLLGDDGRIERYISLRFDVTASKRAEAELLVTTERFTMATEAGGIGIWDLNLDSQRLTWDARMRELYGARAADEDGGLPVSIWEQALAEEDRARVQAEFGAALAGGKPFDTEFRIRTPDGRLRHIGASAHIQRDASGRPVRVMGVNFDVTHRRQAELQLLETSSLLENVLEAASEISLIATDPNLVIRVFNSGAERLLGYQASEVVGATDLIALHDAVELASRAEELARTLGTPVDHRGALVHPSALREPREWTYLRKDGSRVSVSLIVTAMYRKDRTLFGYLGVAQDVTRQKEYEATLREATRRAEAGSRAKSEFLANISHEIRTPMNAVLGLSFLLGQTPMNGDQAALLSKIHVAGKGLLALINDVLDLSKIEAGELTLDVAAFSVTKLTSELHDVFGVQARGKGITLDVHVSPDVPDRLQGDVLRLNQILANLLSNALKFTERGSVSLQVSRAPAALDQPTLLFEVRDSGIGIGVEEQARLFQPFAQADPSTTRRFGGTGLGLSIVKHLATMMRGSVSVRSTRGAGSTFRVELPFELPKEEASIEVAETPLLGNLALLGVRILVVDDSELNTLVAKRILQREGAVVTVASNGRAALERLRSKPAECDVVLMDVQMPIMDGREATRRIRSELGLTELPVIALTADARTSERHEASLAGMNDFLPKPFEPETLLRCIRRHVTPRPADGAPGAAVTSLPSLRAASDWPEITGIDGPEARKRVGGDRALFESLVRYLVRDFRDRPAYPEDGAVEGVAAYVARVHRLRGGAGQVGARATSELCARAESSFRSGDLPMTARLARELDDELAALLASAETVLGSGERRELFSDGAVTSPETPHLHGEKLQGLLRLLGQQNLAAIDELQAVAASVRALLGDQRFSDLCLSIEELRFADAADALRAAISSSSA